MTPTCHTDIFFFTFAYVLPTSLTIMQFLTRTYKRPKGCCPLLLVFSHPLLGWVGLHHASVYGGPSDHLEPGSFPPTTFVISAYCALSLGNHSDIPVLTKGLPRSGLYCISVVGNVAGNLTGIESLTFVLLALLYQLFLAPYVLVVSDSWLQS